MAISYSVKRNITNAMIFPTLSTTAKGNITRPYRFCKKHAHMKNNLISGCILFLVLLALAPKVNGQNISANSWRYCSKCYNLFFDGFNGKGQCAAGGGHIAQGYFFKPASKIAGNVPVQDQWKYCSKCYSLFYNGYPQKGACAKGGEHKEVKYNFSLGHDVNGQAHTKNQWRFCNKCFVLFYNGYTPKGVCIKGGGHQADGYNFVLPYVWANL